jgi:hypothetical protein
MESSSLHMSYLFHREIVLPSAASSMNPNKKNQKVPDPVNTADDPPTRGGDSRDIRPRFLMCGHERYQHGQNVSASNAAGLAEEQPRRIHSVRDMVCRTKFHALWEHIDDVERGWIPQNSQYQFWRGRRPPFPFWPFLIARKPNWFVSV